MAKQVDAEKMKQMARMISKEIPGLGFCLLTFDFKSVGMSNYISNAKREDMIKALFECAERLKRGKDFMTPTDN